MLHDDESLNSIFRYWALTTDWFKTFHHSVTGPCKSYMSTVAYSMASSNTTTFRWSLKSAPLFADCTPTPSVVGSLNYEASATFRSNSTIWCTKWFNQVESRLNLKSAPLYSDLTPTPSVAGSWNYVASAAQKLVAGGGRKRIGTFSLFRLSIRKSHFPIKLRKAAAWKQLKHSAADSSLKC